MNQHKQNMRPLADERAQQNVDRLIQYYGGHDPFAGPQPEPMCEWCKGPCQVATEHGRRRRMLE